MKELKIYRLKSKGHADPFTMGFNGVDWKSKKARVILNIADNSAAAESGLETGVALSWYGEGDDYAVISDANSPANFLQYLKKQIRSQLIIVLAVFQKKSLLSRLGLNKSSSGSGAGKSSGEFQKVSCAQECSRQPSITSSILSSRVTPLPTPTPSLLGMPLHSSTPMKEAAPYLDQSGPGECRPLEKQVRHNSVVVSLSHGSGSGSVPETFGSFPNSSPKLTQERSSERPVFPPPSVVARSRVTQDQILPIRASAHLLEDDTIEKGLRLIQEAFPSVLGMRSSVQLSLIHAHDALNNEHLAYLPIPKQSDAVHIHYSPARSHWVTSAVIKGRVFLWDSLSSPTQDPDVSKEIGFVYEEFGGVNSSVKVSAYGLDMQKDGTSCGLYALLFAMEAARSLDGGGVLPHMAAYPPAEVIRRIFADALAENRLPSVQELCGRRSLRSSLIPLQLLVTRVCCGLVDEGSDWITCQSCLNDFHAKPSCTGLGVGEVMVILGTNKAFYCWRCCNSSVPSPSSRPTAIALGLAQKCSGETTKQLKNIVASKTSVRPSVSRDPFTQEGSSGRMHPSSVVPKASRRQEERARGPSPVSHPANLKASKEKRSASSSSSASVHSSSSTVLLSDTQERSGGRARSNSASSNSSSDRVGFVRSEVHVVKGLRQDFPLTRRSSFNSSRSLNSVVAGGNPHSSRRQSHVQPVGGPQSSLSTQLPPSKRLSKVQRRADSIQSMDGESKERAPRLEWTKGQRGNDKAAVGGFFYTWHREIGGGVSHWQCDKRWSKCKAVLILKNYRKDRLHECLVVKEPEASEHHTHEGNAVRKECLDARAKLKAGAQSEGKPRKILSKALQGISEPAAMLLPPDVYLKRNIQRQRQRDRKHPSIPQRMEEIPYPLPDKFLSTPEGQKFCVFDEMLEGKRTLMFATKRMLRLLGNAKTLFVDGTFKVVPSTHEQLLTFHAEHNGDIVPCLFVLCAGFSADMYKDIMQWIREESGCRPRHVVCDFELALHQAIRSVFRIEPTGCLFHLAQILIRRLQANGLYKQYCEDKDGRLAIWARMLLALAFVPVEDVRFIFELLANHPDRPRRLDDLYEHWATFYIGNATGYNFGPQGRARYPPNVWNFYDITLRQRHPHRTNNAAEGFHRGLQDLFRCSHPDLWVFIETIGGEADDLDRKISRLEMGEAFPRKEVYQRIDRNILNLVEHYQDTNTDVLAFCRGIAYNLASRSIKSAAPRKAPRKASRKLPSQARSSGTDSDSN